MTSESFTWFKSSYSNDQRVCVEVSADLLASGTVPVRDSKNPAGPVIGFSAEAFGAFVAGTKHTEV
ncbi:DUF397 domain-containing protein (plasmid) [Streptomyces sp. BI20]|uniref:DUF397 domain-containing protein n=1 Tax=Streptomyces sp. BI20 TaxID=3403460 RepID=UPI003C75C8BB